METIKDHTIDLNFASIKLNADGNHQIKALLKANQSSAIFAVTTAIIIS